MEGGEGCLPCCRTYKTKILKLPFVAAIHHKLACRSPNCVCHALLLTPTQQPLEDERVVCFPALWRRLCWLVVSVAR